jgi:hypothetical protein
MVVTDPRVLRDSLRADKVRVAVPLPRYFNSVQSAVLETCELRDINIGQNPFPRQLNISYVLGSAAIRASREPITLKPYDPVFEAELTAVPTANAGR